MMEIAGTLLIALSVYQQLCEASAISLNDNWVLTNENKSERTDLCKFVTFIRNLKITKINI